MNRGKQSAADRPRGRPVDTGQGDLRARILDTAEELFTEHGFAATSIRHIAETAGVNPALVHYYFGNKKSLLQSVMERTLAPLVQAVAAMKKSPQVSPESIADLLISTIAEHPNVPRLLTREVLLPGGELQQYFTTHMAPQLGGALPGLLEREKSNGRLREDCDPAVSALLLMAVCIFPFVARALAEPVLGIGYDRGGIEHLKLQVTQLLLKGMEA